MLPQQLVGKPYERSYLCPQWELRVTARCLEDDLGRAADTPFKNLLGIEIIKALTRDRFHRVEDTRQVYPLTIGQPVWVLSHQDHRGGTLYDEEEHVIWLLASRRHRSGAPDDFFPYCKGLDASGVLLPTAEDYSALARERGRRLAHFVRVEAPLVLKAARNAQTEQRVMLGGQFGVCLAIETAENLEATTIAFRPETISAYEHVPMILTAFHADAGWEDVDAMPSRELKEGEIAFQHIHQGP